MEKLYRIFFASLDGAPPPGQSLDILPPPAAVGGIVRSTFSPFLAEGGTFETLSSKAVEAPTTGLLLVYAYGHAWLGPDGPQSSSRSGGSVLEGAHELLERLIPASAAERIILILDCCHAAAFDAFIVPPRVPRLVVYASGAEEKAIALTGERASRLSLSFADKISRGKDLLDLVRAVSEVAEQLDRDGVLRGQTVSYRMSGRGIILARGRTQGERKRERTVTIVRNALLAGGAVAAVVLIGLGWFYWTHALVDVDLAGLSGVARDVRLVASEEDPTSNGSRIFAKQVVTGNRTRLWVPASNVLLRIQATYSDRADRALAFHLNLQSSLSPVTKSIRLMLPPAETVQAHPGMAFVPVTNWFHGREREPRTNPHPFWIDIRPPTVAEYLRVADGLLRSGQLDRENSFVLSARQRSSAVDSVGLGQLGSLNTDLGAIFGAVEAGTSPRVAAPSDIVVGLGELPCETCPAPMTRHEAELYCQSRNMRLPTDLEWELAVRGVDGRVYPWGNQFDESRANVPGLPDKGEASPALKPVDAYPNERSPFGLIDTVGNAGDWVVNETGSYERVYMGATYRYNQEDATAFRMLPITDSDYLVREITVRCAADVPTATQR
jgi:formylglycine-generating enzyme required for sulfatase activity